MSTSSYMVFVCSFSSTRVFEETKNACRFIVWMRFRKEFFTTIFFGNLGMCCMHYEQNNKARDVCITSNAIPNAIKIWRAVAWHFFFLFIYASMRNISYKIDCFLRLPWKSNTGILFLYQIQKEVEQRVYYL